MEPSISSSTWESVRNANSQLLNRELCDRPSDLYFFYAFQMILMPAVRVTGVKSLVFRVTLVWV